MARIETLAAKIAEARGLRRQAVEEAEALIISLHLKLAGARSVRLDEVLVLDERKKKSSLDESIRRQALEVSGKVCF